MEEKQSELSFKTIFTAIERIKIRPGMYIGSFKLSDMQKVLLGYQLAVMENEYERLLTDNGIAFEYFDFFTARKFGIENAYAVAGYEKIILSHTDNNQEKALNVFFELIEEFQQLKIVDVKYCRLSEEKKTKFSDTDTLYRVTLNDGTVFPAIQKANERIIFDRLSFKYMPDTDKALKGIHWQEFSGDIKIQWHYDEETPLYHVPKIWDLIELIKQNPEIFLGSKKMINLPNILYGYQFACDGEPDRYFTENHISIGYLHFFAGKKYHNSSSMGYAGIILEQMNNDEEKALEVCFDVINEFKVLKITGAWELDLSEENRQYNRTQPNVARISYNGGKDIPLYSDSKGIYKIQLSDNTLLLAEQDRNTKYFHFDGFVFEKNIEKHLEKCFGEIKWKRFSGEISEIKLV